MMYNVDFDFDNNDFRCDYFLCFYLYLKTTKLSLFLLSFMTITMAEQYRGEFLDVPTLSFEFCVDEKYAMPFWNSLEPLLKNFCFYNCFTLFFGSYSPIF